MAKALPAAMIAMIIVVALVAGILFYTPRTPPTASGGVTPNACPTSPQQYAISVLSSSGTLGCMVVSASAGVASITQGAHVLTGAITFANSTTIGVDVTGQTIYFKVLSIPWSLLTSVPNIVNTLAQGTHTISGSIVFVNSTSIGIDISGQNVIIKLLSQTCGAGTAVTTVADTIACSNVITTLTQGSYTLHGALAIVNSTTIGVQVSGQNLYFKVLAVPWSLLTSFPSACGSHNWATGASSGAFTCSQPSWSDIASIPGACSAGQFYSNLASSTCGAPSWTALTNFPSGCSAGQYVTAVGSTLTCGTPTGSTATVHLDSNEGLSTSTPIMVQNTYKTFTSGTSTTLAFSKALGANDIALVCESFGGDGVTVVAAPGAATDSLGLTYTNTNAAGGTAVGSGVWCGWAKTNGGGSDTITTGTYPVTCSGTFVCAVAVFEVSGSAYVLVPTTLSCERVSGAGTAMACGGTTLPYTGNPLFLGVGGKGTSGTSTAGTGMTDLNSTGGGATNVDIVWKGAGSASATFTCPNTIATSTFAMVCVMFIEETPIFTVSLPANTIYSFHASLSYVGTSQSGANNILYLHAMGQSGVSIETACLVSGLITTNNVCYAAAETTLFATIPSTTSQPYEFFGTIKVGSTATTLILAFGDTTLASTNVVTWGAGSFIQVAPAT